MAISGMLSSLASAMAVTRFVAPGPLVAMHTPGLPVRAGVALGGERARLARAAAGSCGAGRLKRVSDWCSGMLAPPG